MRLKTFSHTESNVSVLSQFTRGAITLPLGCHQKRRENVGKGGFSDTALTEHYCVCPFWLTASTTCRTCFSRPANKDRSSIGAVGLNTRLASRSRLSQALSVIVGGASRCSSVISLQSKRRCYQVAWFVGTVYTAALRCRVAPLSEQTAKDMIISHVAALRSCTVSLRDLEGAPHGAGPGVLVVRSRSPSGCRFP